MTENQIPANRRPFLAAPDAARYFPGGAIEEARQKLTHNLERSAGVALVIGGAGLGKSMLLEVLAAQFAGDRTTLTLAGAQLCTRRALLQVILFQLGLPFRDLTEGELRLSILSHLKQQCASSANQATATSQTGRLLLLVDEAESLPVRLLEELRVLTNVAHAGTPLVDLILAGGPSLEERFAEPELENFNQRVTLRCYVAPLGREETFQYVRSQVAASGGNPAELFSQEGLEAIYSATDGIPRLVNQLGDQLAWMAEQSGYKPIDAALVQQAWAELQQLPAPWNMDDGPLANRTSEPSPFSSETSYETAGKPVAPIGDNDETVESAASDNSVLEFGDFADASVVEIGGEREETCRTSEGSTTEAEIPQIESLDVESSDAENLDAENLETEYPDDGEEDDAMPASIPFGATSVASTSLADYDDCSDATIDATEKLLAELGEIGGGDPLFSPHERTPQETAPQETAPRETAPQETAVAETDDDGADPFGGGFDEEEIVIDPYANFEAEMLNFAPDVMNFLDVGFAAGLNRVTPHESTTAPTKPALAAVVYDEPAVSDSFDGEPIEPTELDLEEAEFVEEAHTEAELMEAELMEEENGKIAVAHAGDSEVDEVKVDACQAESADIELDDSPLKFNGDEAFLPVESCFQPATISQQPMPTVSANKVLVLEDDGRGMAEVVPGRQFRRLFSGLEAGS